MKSAVARSALIALAMVALTGPVTCATALAGTRPRPRPVKVHLPKGVKVQSARAGFEFATALTTTGKVLTWGPESYDSYAVVKKIID